MTEYGDIKFYFQYANPVETEDELAGQKRPTMRGTKHPWENSPYYYWWLFLKENTDYKETCDGNGEGPCSVLYADFGDVRPNNFMAWWLDRGRQLFCEPHGAISRIVPPGERSYADPAFRIVVELERFGDTDRAVAEVRSILKEQRPEGEFGRGGRNVSRALYQLFTKPNLHSFREHYQAHLLLKARPDISDDEFVKQAKIKVGSASVASAAKAYRASIASMIKYAGEGVFPIMTAAQAKRIPAYRQNRKLAAQERRREIAAGVHCIPFGRPEEPEPVLSNSMPNHGFRGFIQRTRCDKTIPSES